MKLSYEDHDRITVLTMSGELTVDQADVFRRSIQERLDAGIRHVVLNMEYVTYVDSAGLEALLWAMDESSARGGHLRLVALDTTVRTILHVTRLERRFNIHDTIESAAKSLR